MLTHTRDIYPIEKQYYSTLPPMSYKTREDILYHTNIYIVKIGFWGQEEERYICSKSHQRLVKIKSRKSRGIKIMQLNIMKGGGV